MATVRGALGQSNPAAGVLTDLYTVPAAKSATARVIVTNRSASDNDAFRISMAPAGAADSLEQYIAYDKGILINDTGSTIAVMLGPGDIVRVRSIGGNLSFTLTGIEQDG